MIRTQISLNKSEYLLAKRESARLGMSLAAMLRIALRNLLPLPAKNPWMRYAGFVQSGDKRSSKNIDEIIYGQKD